MLNSIATSLIGYADPAGRTLGVQLGGTNDLTTGEIPESGWFPGIDIGAAGDHLRLHLPRRRCSASATGSSSTAPASASTCAPPAPRESAAQASGVDAKKMVAHRHADLRRASPAWPACRLLLGDTHTYSLTSRSASASPASPSPCSAATTRSASLFAALLWAFLDKASGRAGLRTGYDKEIVDDHAGPDRARGRRRLRGSCAATASAASSRRSARSSPPQATPHRREGGGGVSSHEHRSTTPTAPQAKRRPDAASCPCP